MYVCQTAHVQIDANLKKVGCLSDRFGTAPPMRGNVNPEDGRPSQPPPRVVGVLQKQSKERATQTRNVTDIATIFRDGLVWPASAPPLMPSCRETPEKLTEQ